MVETALADGTERAFHPKSWLFEGASFGVAFVGSSNLSASALGAGIEWNLRVERGIDAVAYGAVRAAVEGLWASAIELSAGWIDAYAERVRERPRSLPPGDGEVERLEAPPLPHEFQGMPPLARRPAAGRRAVPSRRVLAPQRRCARAEGTGSATYAGLRMRGHGSSVGDSKLFASLTPICRSR